MCQHIYFCDHREVREQREAKMIDWLRNVVLVYCEHSHYNILVLGDEAKETKGKRKKGYITQVS